MGRRVVLRERLSQPQSLTGVDWGNPITRGLEAIETPTVPSGRDSGTLIAISGGLARQSTRAGQGYKGSGASSALYRNIGLTVNPSAGQTILALVVGTTGTDSRIFSVASPSSMILAIGSGQTTASKVRYFYRTPGSDIGTGETTAVAFEAGIPHVAIMRYEPGFLSIFVDGKLDATQSATASGTSASSLQVAVGAVVRAGSASLFSSSSLVLGVYWNRALSNAEIASVSANPWQLFEPQTQSRSWASGTTYLKSVLGSLNPSGIISRSVNKRTLGNITSTGVAVKSTRTSRQGSITTSAGPVVSGSFAQSASGSITISSVLTDAVTFVRSYGSSITLSGALAKPVYKLLTGSIALVGSVFKLVTKVAFTASMTLTGALSAFSFTPGVGGGVLGRGLRFMRKFIGRR